MLAQGKHCDYGVMFEWKRLILSYYYNYMVNVTEQISVNIMLIDNFH